MYLTNFPILIINMIFRYTYSVTLIDVNHSYMVGTCRVNGLNNIVLLNCRYHTGAYTMHLDLTCSNIFQYAIQHSSGEIGIWAILWSHKMHMMTSWNANIFHVTGPLWGEITVHRWIPLSKTNVAELWCFLWSALEQTVEQTIETTVIWDAIASL